MAEHLPLQWTFTVPDGPGVDLEIQSIVAIEQILERLEDTAEDTNA